MNSLVRDLTLDPAPLNEAFRTAMRHLAGGVSVLTVGRGENISGMTVTSVSSLSVEPATVFVSVNRQSSSWPLLVRHNAFGLNVLSAEQRDIAERFSGKDGLQGAARFIGAPWIMRASHPPLLSNALAAFACDVEHFVERHSHAIVIGRVRDVQSTAPAPALVYWQGGYHSVGDV